MCFICNDASTTKPTSEVLISNLNNAVIDGNINNSIRSDLDINKNKEKVICKEKALNVSRFLLNISSRSNKIHKTETKTGNDQSNYSQEIRLVAPSVKKSMPIHDNIVQMRERYLTIEN